MTNIEKFGPGRDQVDFKGVYEVSDGSFPNTGTLFFGTGRIYAITEYAQTGIETGGEEQINVPEMVTIPKPVRKPLEPYKWATRVAPAPYDDPKFDRKPY